MKSSVMRISNITMVGLRAIARNKMRSFLTALGIIIGVGCVIAVVAIGNGATKSIENTINALGTNYIMVFPGASTSSRTAIRCIRRSCASWRSRPRPRPPRASSCRCAVRWRAIRRPPWPWSVSACGR